MSMIDETWDATIVEEIWESTVPPILEDWDAVTISETWVGTAVLVEGVWEAVTVTETWISGGPTITETWGQDGSSISTWRFLVGAGSAGGDPAGVVQATFTAGEALSGHRAVRLRSDGMAYYADSTDIADSGRSIGITVGAAALGDAVVVQSLGAMVEGSWAWNPALPIFLGANGLLTQTVPSSPADAFSQMLAYPATPTEIFVSLGPDPVTLA